MQFILHSLTEKHNYLCPKGGDDNIFSQNLKVSETKYLLLAHIGSLLSLHVCKTGELFSDSLQSGKESKIFDVL